MHVPSMLSSVLKILMSIIYLLSAVCDCENKNPIKLKQKYRGEKFNTKYSYVDDIVPTKIDLLEYMTALYKMLTYLSAKPNDTCTNRALGSFFVKAVLQRTLQDDGEKLDKFQKEMLMSLIHKSDVYLSHFIYLHTTSISKGAKNGNLQKILRTFANFMKAPEVFGLSLPTFSKNQLKQWIYTDYNMNIFVKDMDSAVLPKEKYVELAVRSATEFHIHILDSDYCLSHVEDNVLPSINSADLKLCRQDVRCKAALHSEPSIAYGLSHKVLNLLLYRYQRHCYWLSPTADLMHINILCAFMYRESVYLAKKGFFARDMFLQHVGFCGMMGYEEFYRRHWFHAALRWMDSNGCITENRNYWINATRFALNHSTSDVIKKMLKTHYKEIFVAKCEEHPMAIMLVFLANAIRHAAHYIPQFSDITN